MIGRGRPLSYYSVLGLESHASIAEIRSAYRKLAMRWHPDKFSACTSDKIDFAKRKFQEIQEAYNVLSDEGKRACYDLQLYDPTQDDDEVQGLSSFVKEMSILMRQVRREGGGSNSFQELQNLFMQMFWKDLEMWNLTPVTSKGCHQGDGQEWRPCAMGPWWENSIQHQKASRKRGRTMSSALRGDPV